MKRHLTAINLTTLFLLLAAVPAAAYFLWTDQILSALFAVLSVIQALSLMLQRQISRTYRELAAHYQALSMFQTHRISVLHALLRKPYV